ncbi:unnamed protein product [Trifolium pratense]|uniref:Uncharacterized protein n=1 Tax=Trifolium pratense TaxID=57577 RepID=A0ACB0JRH9_TRIPR|nr:unnamed protein product [Trifolium pratense]
MMIILFFVMCLVTSSTTANTFDDMHDLELERQLNLINKFPIKSIQTMSGYIVDCVDINSQPAFSHPLLKKHKLQRKPSFGKQNSETSVNSSSTKFIHMLEKVSCPKGTVPNRRITKDDVNQGKSLFNDHILTQNSIRTYYAELFANALNGPYYGVSGITSIYNPKVIEGQTSGSHIYVENGKGDGDIAQDGIVARCYSEEITTRSIVARNDDEEMIFKKELLLVDMLLVALAKRKQRGSFIARCYDEEASNEAALLLVTMTRRLVTRRTVCWECFKMSESEEVVEVQGAEKYTLVDCITDPALDWVAPEPRGIASALTPEDPKLHTTVEQRRANEPKHWSTRLPGEDERVCSSFDGHDFAMYEFVFKEMGLRLPFSPFAASVLKALQVAPSQLHPNSWSFIMAFEHLCVYKGVRPSLPLFFRIFKIQRKPTKEVGRAPRQNWVSLKHHEDVKLFKMFVDSIKDFKERYYIVRPESPSARESLLELEEDIDEQGIARKDASGQVRLRAVPKFPLSWSYTHFQKEPKEYTTGDADLSPEDRAAFESLKAFVAGFTPGVWTTRKEVIIRDKHGEPRVSPRYINTRTLLKCKNAGETKWKPLLSEC